MQLTLRGNEACQRRDASPPHTRIVVATIVIVGVVACQSEVGLALFALLSCYLWWRSSVCNMTNLKRLILIDSLIAITILPLPFTFVDQSVVTLGPITMSKVGLLKAAEVFLKSTIAVSIMLSQITGMSELQLTKALHRLSVPVKFIQLLQFSIRYISVIQQELAKLKMAMRARGLCKAPLTHKLRSYGYLFGMVFVKALARADRIWFAMKCRGYRGLLPQSKAEKSQRLMTYESKAITLAVIAILAIDLSEMSRILYF